MARRTQDVTIDDKDSRDFGNVYRVTEMDSESAEWWAFRVLQALLGSEVKIDFDAPLQHLARQGLTSLSRLPADQAKPLLTEMMTCVKRLLPDGKSTRDLLPGDIEEVSTRVKLRAVVLELHVGFFELGGALTGA